MVRSVARDHCSSPAGSSPSGRRKEEATLWQNRLLSCLDGKRLEGCLQAPVSSLWGREWLSPHAWRCLRGSTQVAWELFADAGPQRTGAPQDRTELRPILRQQAREPRTHSPALSSQRLARHNGLLEKYIFCFQEKEYQTRREAAVPTVASVRYFDIICWSQNESHVMDIQVVADAAAGSLDVAHMRKVAYYAALWNPSLAPSSHLVHYSL